MVYGGKNMTFIIYVHKGRSQYLGSMSRSVHVHHLNTCSTDYYNNPWFVLRTFSIVLFLYTFPFYLSVICRFPVTCFCLCCLKLISYCIGSFWAKKRSVHTNEIKFLLFWRAQTITFHNNPVTHSCCFSAFVCVTHICCWLPLLPIPTFYIFSSCRTILSPKIVKFWLVSD